MVQLIGEEARESLEDIRMKCTDKRGRMLRLLQKVLQR